jgi:hypothetical protein
VAIVPAQLPGDARGLRSRMDQCRRRSMARAPLVVPVVVAVVAVVARDGVLCEVVAFACEIVEAVAVGDGN